MWTGSAAVEIMPDMWVQEPGVSAGGNMYLGLLSMAWLFTLSEMFLGILHCGPLKLLGHFPDVLGLFVFTWGGAHGTQSP